MAASAMSRCTPREPTNADLARYLPLVDGVVRRMLRRLPSNVRREDLYAAGLFGLYDSMRRNFDEQGPRFEWYARIRIRGAILDELRAQDWLPRRARWVAAGRRPATPGNNPPAAVVRFDDLGAQDAGFLVDGTSIDSGEALDHRHDCAALARAIDHLPERERTIVRLHYFEGVRFKDIGALLGVSEPRISQLHARAVGRLRAAMREEEAA